MSDFLNTLESPTDYADDVVSYNEMLSDELDQSSDYIEDNDESYSQEPRDNNDANVISDLKLKASDAQDCIKEYDTDCVEKTVAEQRLFDAVNANLTLIESYGDSDALEHLIELFNDVQDRSFQGVIEQIIESFKSVISYDVLPIIEQDYHTDAPRHVTIELQNMLLDAMYNDFDLQSSPLLPVLEAFKNNDYYASDSRLNSN